MLLFLSNLRVAYVCQHACPRRISGRAPENLVFTKTIINDSILVRDVKCLVCVVERWLTNGHAYVCAPQFADVKDASDVIGVAAQRPHVIEATVERNRGNTQNRGEHADIDETFDERGRAAV